MDEKDCPICKEPIREDVEESIETPVENPVEESAQEPIEEVVEEAQEEKPKFCANCGNRLAEEQVFCPACGFKTVDIPAPVAPAEDISITSNATAGKKKKNIMIAVIAGAAFLCLILICALVFPKVFVSVDDLCARGEYSKAYEKAKGDEKIAVKAESIAAECSAKTSDSMKNPSSFELRRAYYKEGLNDDGTPNGQLVLEVLGTNSYGGRVTNYWLYTWDSVNKWELWDSYSDLSEEEYGKYDTDSEKLEKLYGNIGKLAIKNTVNNGMELGKEAIKRINNLFKEDKLDGVESINMR